MYQLTDTRIPHTSSCHICKDLCSSEVYTIQTQSQRSRLSRLHHLNAEDLGYVTTDNGANYMTHSVKNVSLYSTLRQLIIHRFILSEERTTLLRPDLIQSPVMKHTILYVRYGQGREIWSGSPSLPNNLNRWIIKYD